jgi:hypothetical protein
MARENRLMLSGHGLAKITGRTEVEVHDGTKGPFRILKLHITTTGRNRDSSERTDTYPAIMYFFDKDSADMWSEQLTVDRYIDIRWATMDGVKIGNDGKERGSVRVRLYPDIRHTMPL